jgi:hypothetical protein
MRLSQIISADEMVAHFLRTEIHSSRFESAILDLLAKDGKDRALVDSPDLHDPSENAYRAELLGKWRGYGRDADVFTGFPDDVVWYRAVLDRADWERVLYINDEDFWNEFSGGSRLVRDAVERIHAEEVPAEEAAWFWPIADALAQGRTFPELILVYNPTTQELVLLEGHVRMTGFLLRPENLPPELPVLLGVSPHMKK